MSETSPASPTADQISAEDALKLVLIDQSHDANDEARDIADARLDKELGEGGRFKRFVNGIWKGNIAKDYYRQKYVSEAIEGIQDTNSVLASSPENRRARALESTIQRYQSDYDELIHTEAGEKREVQADDGQLAQGMKQIIRRFVEGDLNAASMQEERTRLLNEYRKQHGPDSIGQGIVTTDNMLQIAQAVAGIVEHSESLDKTQELNNTLAKVQVITGEARDGARTEARYTTVDKGIDWLSKRKITSIVTPGTLIVGVTAAAAIARVGSHTVIGTLTKAIVPGAAAGVWAGLKEHKRTNDERSQHAREMTVGGEFEATDKRRNEMEATRYKTIAAQDLINHLNEVGDQETLANGSEAVQAALDALAAVQARIQLSDSKNVDLISYSKKEDVGEERMMLDLARREVRLALEANMTDEVRTSLSIAPNKTVRQLVEDRTTLYAKVLREGNENEDGMDAKDAAFKSLKKHRVAKAAVIGAVTGIAGGLIVQEAVSAFDPTRFGLMDMIRGETPVANSDGLVHQTTIESIFRGDETVVHTDPSSAYDAYPTGAADQGKIELSDDHTLEKNPDGTLNLIDKEGKADVEGLVVGPDGTLDQPSLDKLDAAGMVVENKSFNESIISDSTVQVSPEQFIENHKAETTSVTRDLWYGNDTPNIYDENEIALYRGGSPDTPGIVDGGYRYTVAGMSAEGSWQGGESVDWNQASANGNLFVAISGTADSQDNPFMIPIGSDGAVNIPADSPAGQFFANEDNAVAFKGAYMEIVQSTGQDAEGTVHIRPLATLIGDESVGPINQTITTETIVHHAEYTITSNGYDTVEGNFTEMAPITPIASRRSMEAIRTPERRNGYYDNGVSERERERIYKDISPRFKENPDAELNPKQELDWHRSELAKNKSGDYVEALEQFAKNNPELKKISNLTESIVTIPVAAASESETIYSTLSLFAQQERESGSNSVILLNVNWLDTAMDDPEKVTAMQRTLSEIERARAAFPNLSIAVMQKEYIQSEVEATGGIIGYVTEDLVNAALISVQQGIAAGSVDPDHDVLIVRSDADVKGQSRKQLQNLERAASENKNLDVVKGVTRFGVADLSRFPGFGIATGFANVMSIASTQENAIHTGGANFGVRASTLAAIGGIGRMYREDENGEMQLFTGAGSDDVLVGRKIRIARDLKGGDLTYYGGNQPGSSSVETRRIKLVSGAAIDTNAERLLPYYLVGRPFQDAWNENTPNTFGDGPGNYSNRDSQAEVIRNAPDEIFNTRDSFRAIEATISQELTWSSDEVGRRALSIFFGGVPGAYKLIGRLGDPNLRFVLTKAGRDFVKNRVERETNGRYGSYGTRKMRQLYGIVKSGARRQPASNVAPLVSPLA